MDRFYLISIKYTYFNQFTKKVICSFRYFTSTISNRLIQHTELPEEISTLIGIDSFIYAVIRDEIQMLILYIYLLFLSIPSSINQVN